MSIRAENDPRYSRKFLIMGILAIGFSLWCLKDAALTYPDLRARGFEEFRSENPKVKTTDPVDFETNASSEERGEWQQYAEHRGFKTSPEIVTQYIMAALTGVAGLALLSVPLFSRGRWIEMNESGLQSSWGQAFQFDQVESLNKRKWRDKGIAKITYRDGNRKRRFVLDDYKFLRTPTNAILFELEQKIGIDKITGGPPEPTAESEDSAGAAFHAPADEAS